MFACGCLRDALGNHAIRMIKSGVVSTVAGQGSAHPGSLDGNCSVARFADPKSIDIRWTTTPASTGGGTGEPSYRLAVVAAAGGRRRRRGGV